MDVPSKVEFCVKIERNSCVESVKQKLKDFGIRGENIETVIDSNKHECRLVIETTKPWIDLQEQIETTGKRAVLVGFSDEAAVAILDKASNGAKGVIRFCSITSSKPGIVIDGVIDNLKPDVDHILTLREYGDISDGFSSLGGVYKNSSYKIRPDKSGRSTIRTVDNKLYISELIGRSVAVESITENKSLVCGIISRAAGIFQNWKRICACDGVTIWEEREKSITT